MGGFLFPLLLRTGELRRDLGLCELCAGIDLQIVHEWQSLKEITSSKRASLLMDFELWAWNMCTFFKKCFISS